MVAGTVALVWIVPKGFLPSEDMGQIFGMTEAAQGISFENMVKHQRGPWQILLLKIQMSAALCLVLAQAVLMSLVIQAEFSLFSSLKKKEA